MVEKCKGQLRSPRYGISHQLHGVEYRAVVSE